MSRKKRFDLEEFFETVRKYRCLYDKSSPEFKDSVLKRTIWTAIGVKFNLTGE